MNSSSGIKERSSELTSSSVVVSAPSFLLLLLWGGAANECFHKEAMRRHII